MVLTVVGTVTENVVVVVTVLPGSGKVVVVVVTILERVVPAPPAVGMSVIVCVAVEVIVVRGTGGYV